MVRVVLRYPPTVVVQHKGNHVLELFERFENLSSSKDRSSGASIHCIVVRNIDSSLMSWNAFNTVSCSS